jgi:hypothetical protein
MKKTTNKSDATSKNNNGREKIRSGLGAAAIAKALIDNLHYQYFNSHCQSMMGIGMIEAVTK